MRCIPLDKSLMVTRATIPETPLFYHVGSSTMRNKNLINRHEKVAQVLLSGKPVSPDEIKAIFEGTNLEVISTRLSQNIWSIKADGGIIKVHKNGRNVTGYQLINPQDFDDNGRYVGNQMLPEFQEEAMDELAELANFE